MAAPVGRAEPADGGLQLADMKSHVLPANTREAETQASAPATRDVRSLIASASAGGGDTSDGEARNRSAEDQSDTHNETQNQSQKKKH